MSADETTDPLGLGGIDPAHLGGTDPLGLGVEQFRALAHGVVDRVADHWANLDSVAVVRRADAEALAALSGPPPRAPADIEELLETLATQALPNMQHAAHPRYFARVPSPASLTGILGDWLGVGYNAIASSWSGGSGPSQLELLVVDWLRELMGFPLGAEGVLVSGGSLGNITALAAARAAGYDGSVLLSDQTHASIGRGLRVLGYAPEQVTVIPTGSEYRLEADAVRAAIRERDRDHGHAHGDAHDHGHGRAILIGTAGYTNTGGVDPLGELAELCAEFDLWFHVDGAYGAPAAMAPSGAAALSGIERADSLTLDPHKWLFQPYDLGCVLVRRPGALEACFAINPEYLRDVQSTDVEEVDMHNRGLELSRRARAVKLWLTLAGHGTAAIAAAIERSILLAQDVQALLDGDPDWEIVTPAQLGVITFANRRLSGSEHVARARRLTDSGFAAVSCTELRGRTVYRLCLINPLTQLADVVATLERL